MLGLRSIFSQHDRDTILDGIDGATLLAAEALFIDNVVQIASALRATENVEQFLLKLGFRHSSLCLL